MPEQLPEWAIAARWHGIYFKCDASHIYQANALAGVELFTGVCGRSMTMSFGLADEYWKQRSKEPRQ